MTNDDIAMLILTDRTTTAIERAGALMMLSPIMGTVEFGDMETINQWRDAR